jgi:Skp family chaperone for outer membrane proteins
VKRIMIVVVVATTAAAIYGGSRLGAQAPAQPAELGAQMRVGFINVARVFHEYEKAKFYKSELEKLIEPKKQLLDKLGKEVTAWKKDMAEKPELKPGGPKYDAKLYERYEKGILANQRQLEDIQKELRQTVGERSEQQNVQLYKELYAAAQRVAADQKFHLVMAYVEPTQGDPFNLVNIMRKVQGMDMGGSVTALYIAPGLELSTTVVEYLNRDYRAAGGVIVPATPVSQQKN